MKIKKPSSITLKILLTISLIALPLSIGPRLVKADPLESISDTIEDSGTSNASNHTIQFDTPSGVAAGETITVTFPAGFTMGSVDEDDVDISDDSVDLTTAANCDASDEASVVVAGQVITITICAGDGGDIAGTSTVVIEIGDNATASGTGANKVTNHATEGPYTIAIDGSMTDSGDALIAMVDDITASVTVDEVLQFTVTGQIFDTNCAAVADSDGNVDTTDTSIPFGTPITTENFIDACHELEVTTNAGDGYQVTIAEDDQLTSGSNQIADGTCDGGCGDTTAAVWTTNTLNGLGYCLIDVTGTDMDSDFSGHDCDDVSPYFKTIPDQGNSETPESVMSNAGEVSGNQVDVGYRISVDGTQAAGVYENEIIYVCTPTY